jgi:GTP-binding protein EngB required for normal cell division
MRQVRETQRGERRRHDVPSVAIVGYTNAGKSSLLNVLTGAGVLVEDALFATLDPTTRKTTTADGRTYTLTDTVGFVRHLPHQLVEAFRSTLEETADADLLVHVVDAADPLPEEQIKAVREVLVEVGESRHGTMPAELLVVNKTDAAGDLRPPWRRRGQAARPARRAAAPPRGRRRAPGALRRGLAGRPGARRGRGARRGAHPGGHPAARQGRRRAGLGRAALRPGRRPRRERDRPLIPAALSGILAALLAVLPGAAPTPQAPQDSCTVTTPALAELSGMVIDSSRDGDAVVALSDGGRRIDLQRLGRALAPGSADCAITGTRRVDIDPYDAEDLARGPDGALWVADIGDNDERRDTVAVIVVPARGAPALHRLRYPDGPHDAEALLVDPTGRPVIVTKQIGSAGVYRTAEPPAGTGPVPLELVGRLSLPASDTEGGPVGAIGPLVVTGAAASADGRVVALRSYTDAWLYPAPDGDPAMALTENPAPVRVPLPDEPQGEAIAFTPDGSLVSGSETRGGVRAVIRVVPGAAALAAPAGGAAVSGVSADPPGPAAPQPGAAAPAAGPAPDWLPAATGGAVAVGLLLVVTLALALRARRR